MGLPENNAALYSPDTNEGGLVGSQETLVVKPIKSWKGYLWDTWELPPDQRWLLFKLDAFVLTFASVRNYPRSPSCSDANKENPTASWRLLMVPSCTS